MTRQGDSRRAVDLCGAVTMARVCNVHEIREMRVVPGTKFKVKVVERFGGDYFAMPNVRVLLPDGTPDYVSGLGLTEAEALQDLLKRFMTSLAQVAQPDDSRFQWDEAPDFLKAPVLARLTRHGYDRWP